MEFQNINDLSRVQRREGSRVVENIKNGVVLETLEDITGIGWSSGSR